MSFKIQLRKRINVSRGPMFLAPALVTADGVVVGDERRDILKIDAKTLETSWKVRAHGFEPRGVVRNDVLLVLGEKGLWKLIEGASGRALWEAEIGTAEGSWWGDRAILDKNPFRVLDRSTGAIVERFEVPGGPIKSVFYDADNDVLLMTTEYKREPKRNEPIRAYHLSERRLLWSKHLASEANTLLGVEEGWPQFVPLPGGRGRFLGARRKTMLCYALADATLLWHQPLEIPYHFPNLLDDRLYAWIHRANLTSHLVALDEPTGQVIYDIPLARHGGPFGQVQQPHQASLGEQHIVFTTRGSSGLIAIFRLADGHLVWSYVHDDEIYRPVVAGNRIYITASSGELLVFEVEGTL